MYTVPQSVLAAESPANSQIDVCAILPGSSQDSSLSTTEQLRLDESLLTSLSVEDRRYITATLEINVQSGRAIRVMTKMSASRRVFTQFWDGEIAYAPSLTWDILWLAYQHRVLVVFTEDSERILALHHHCDLAWQALAQQLTGRAIQLLMRAGVGLGCACDRGAEMAQQVCECALSHAYPCDVPLDYWLSTILKNVNLQVWTRSQDLLDRDPAMHSLEEMEDRGVSIAARSFMCAAANHAMTDPSCSSTQMDALIGAVNRMQSEERRLVVAYTYFADMTDDEIAARLHKSKAVVHILRHRALKQLRSLIDE
ncbi:MAG: hypothetical protein M9936_02740 [Caldilinea sp.]|nr:hypothetical protein [Caldilinea sp.]MCB0060041.1 hypothetical protein [Caldilineaceae bacterium]MCB9140676.1 hypothetical protein [Anaerolineales bacterium]MCB0048581.1 hypothetical protein [Caldilinea sp.]MCB0066723.1 hypothetical protein [Caldilineaceae bacterium]